MTKAEFLGQLQVALSRLPQSEIEHSLAFYAEMIDDRIEDGISEQEAVAQLGDVNQIAAQIIAEAPFVSRTVAKAKSNSTNMVLIVILLVVLSPVWLPLAVGIFATLFSVYISIWAVLLSLWSFVLAMLVTGFACLGALIFLCATGNPLTGVLAAGIGLVCIGLGIFAFFGVLALTKLVIRMTVWIARKIKSLFVKQDKQWQSGQPIQPDQPVQPVQAAYPDQPTQPTQPSQPSQPIYQQQQQQQQPGQEVNNA